MGRDRSFLVRLGLGLFTLDELTRGDRAFRIGERIGLFAFSRLGGRDLPLFVRLGFGLLALDRLLGPDLDVAQGLGYQVALGRPLGLRLVRALGDLPYVPQNAPELLVGQPADVASAQVPGGFPEFGLQIVQRFGELLLRADLGSGQGCQLGLDGRQALPTGLGEVALLLGSSPSGRGLFPLVIDLDQLTGLGPDPAAFGQALPTALDSAVQPFLELGPVLGLLILAFALILREQMAFPGLFGIPLELAGSALFLTGSLLGGLDGIADKLLLALELLALPIFGGLLLRVLDVVLGLLDPLRDLLTPLDLPLSALLQGLCSLFAPLLLSLCIFRLGRVDRILRLVGLRRLGCHAHFPATPLQIPPGLGLRAPLIITAVFPPASLGPGFPLFVEQLGFRLRGFGRLLPELPVRALALPSSVLGDVAKAVLQTDQIPNRVPDLPSRERRGPGGRHRAKGSLYTAQSDLQIHGGRRLRLGRERVCPFGPGIRNGGRRVLRLRNCLRLLRGRHQGHGQLHTSGRLRDRAQHGHSRQSESQRLEHTLVLSHELRQPGHPVMHIRDGFAQVLSPIPQLSGLAQFRDRTDQIINRLTGFVQGLRPDIDQGELAYVLQCGELAGDRFADFLHHVVEHAPLDRQLLQRRPHIPEPDLPALD